jgi:hypothetical protein
MWLECGHVKGECGYVQRFGLLESRIQEESMPWHLVDTAQFRRESAEDLD